MLRHYCGLPVASWTHFSAYNPKEHDELSLLHNKLAPARINQMLAFSALFQLVHGAIKIQVLDKTKSFFRLFWFVQ